MSSNQKPLKTAMFLALLALAVRGKASVAATASLARKSVSAPACAARALFGLACRPLETAGAAFRAAGRVFAKARGTCVILSVLACAVVFYFVEIGLTQPGKSTFWAPLAHERLVSQLAPYGLLDPAADWTAQWCANGEVGRKGADNCPAANPAVELGDARPLFADAVRVYEGHAPRATNPELKKAAGVVARRMIQNRNEGLVFGDWFMLIMIAFEFALVGWGMFLAIVIVVNVKKFVEWSVRKDLAAVNPQAAMLSMMMWFGLPMFVGFIAWGVMITAGALWGAQQMPWLADRALLWGEFSQPAYQMPDASGSNIALGSFALRQRANQPGASVFNWVSRPNNLGLRRTDDRGASKTDIPLGRWTPTQMASADAPAQLARQAPNLTPEQRRAALVDLSFARDRQVALGTIMGRGASLFGALCLAGFSGTLLFLFLRWIFQGALSASSKTLQDLAEEGAQIPLARRERKAMEDEMRKTESESNVADERRPARQAKRL